MLPERENPAGITVQWGRVGGGERRAGGEEAPPDGKCRRGETGKKKGAQKKKAINTLSVWRERRWRRVFFSLSLSKGVEERMREEKKKEASEYIMKNWTRFPPGNRWRVMGSFICVAGPAARTELNLVNLQKEKEKKMLHIGEDDATWTIEFKRKNVFITGRVTRATCTVWNLWRPLWRYTSCLN